MIIKNRDPYVGKDKFEKSGIKAEEEMAWYLKRAFSKDENVFVFNDLRLAFDDNDHFQIDHLIMHSHGFILIESKSVSSEVQIDIDGYWERLWEKSWRPMASPLKQVAVQAEGLRQRIEDQTLILREKSLFGLIQRTFDTCPYDLVVAISNLGKIVGNNTDEIMKAENVSDYVKHKIKSHQKAWKKKSKNAPVYFRDNEPELIKSFLLDSHCPKYSGRKNSLSNPIKEVKKPIISHPQKISPPEKNNDYWICSCGGNYDIRYANTTRYGKSFYRYCPDCRGRRRLIAKCPTCDSDVSLMLTERISTFTCIENSTHQGVFYKNKKLWLKDKHALASHKTRDD